VLNAMILLLVLKFYYAKFDLGKKKVDQRAASASGCEEGSSTNLGSGSGLEIKEGKDS